MSLGALLEQLAKQPVCICSQDCECEKPPTEESWDRDAFHGTSDECPVHTEDPIPNRFCTAAVHWWQEND